MVTAGCHLVCNRPFLYLQEFNVLPSLYHHLYCYYSFVYITYMYGYVFLYVYLYWLLWLRIIYIINFSYMVFQLCAFPNINDPNFVRN